MSEQHDWHTKKDKQNCFPFSLHTFWIVFSLDWIKVENIPEGSLRKILNVDENDLELHAVWIFMNPVICINSITTKVFNFKTNYLLLRPLS